MMVGQVMIETKVVAGWDRSAGCVVWCVLPEAVAVGMWLYRLFLRLRARFDGLAGWRSSVVPRGLRWRAAVFVNTTAHRSESLRTRHVGGCLPRLVGA